MAGNTFSDARGGTGANLDDQQQFIDLVGEMEPGISLEDLLKAKAAARKSLEDITEKLGKLTTVAIRHNILKMHEGIYYELCDVLEQQIR